MALFTRRASLALLFVHVGCTEAIQRFQPKTNDVDRVRTDTSDAGGSTGNEVIAGDSSRPEIVVGDVGKVPPAKELDALIALPTKAAQLAVLCARPGQDRVRQVFCGATPPSVTSLTDLQTALGISFVSGTRPQFAITGHSSSLVARFVNSINPRAIIFTPVNGDLNSLVAMGFTRGEQFAEVAARDPVSGRLNFFLFHFEQACNSRETGCSVGELLTPAIESNWTGLTIYEDEDLKNTVFDCMHCHQPNGPNSPKMLRMQELRNPWTHFFRDNLAGGQALIADFVAAHGTTEGYAGIPANRIADSDPADLEDLVRDAGFGNQPNEFPTRNIEQQVAASSSSNQPIDNSVPGTSAAWQTLFDRFVAGEVIAPPYHDVKVTDPQKLATMTRAYQDWQSGSLPMERLPDIRDAFLDDKLFAMGFRMKPNATAEEILMSACAQCHNSNLRQDISRANFNVDLSRTSAEKRLLAIERLKLPENDPKRMPPARFRDLTGSEIQKLENLLRP